MEFRLLLALDRGAGGTVMTQARQRSAGRRAAAATDRTRARNLASMRRGASRPAAWPLHPRSRPERSEWEKRSIEIKVFSAQPAKGRLATTAVSGRRTRRGSAAYVDHG